MPQISVYLPAGVDLKTLETLADETLDYYGVHWNIDPAATNHPGYTVAIDVYLPHRDDILGALCRRLKDVIESELGVICVVGEVTL